MGSKCFRAPGPPHGAGSTMIAWSGSIARTRLAVRAARACQSSSPSSTKPFERLVHQVVAPDGLVAAVAPGDLVPDLDERLLEPGLVEHPALARLVASAGRRVQVDEHLDPKLLADRQQPVEVGQGGFEPGVVGGQVALVGRAVGEPAPEQLPPHVIGLPLAAQDAEVGLRDVRADHRAAEPRQVVALVGRARKRLRGPLGNRDAGLRPSRRRTTPGPSSAPGRGSARLPWRRRARQRRSGRASSRTSP